MKTKKSLISVVAAFVILTFVLIACVNILPSFDIVFAKNQNEIACGEEMNILFEATGLDPDEYQFVAAYDAAFGKVLRFQQYFDGKQIYGAQITVSVDDKNNILSTSGKYAIAPAFEKTISCEQAKNIAFENCGVKDLCCEEVYFYDGKQTSPAYRIAAEDMNEVYFVDAKSGDVLYRDAQSFVTKQNTDAFENTVDINVEYDEDSQTFLMHDEERHIYAVNMNGKYMNERNLSYQQYLKDVYSSNTGEDFDPLAVTIFKGFEKAYDFYTDPNNIGAARYGVNDKNNDGDDQNDYKLFLLVNYGIGYLNADFSVLTNGETQQKLDYAFVRIGNGTNRKGELYMQGRALDILAHEYQHGVTAFTAGFNYAGEAGALDEAFSDIFGSLVEGNDPTDLNSAFWTIGENGVYDPNDEGLVLRSLKGGTPGQAYSVDEKDQNNEVHANSTIISHIQYELSALAPTFFTRQEIGKLWYSTLLKLTPMSNFEDFAQAFVASAAELNYSEDIQDNVIEALAAVGLMDSNHHIVTFVGFDNKVVTKKVVEDGGSVAFPSVPKYMENEYFSCEFEAWVDAENGETYNIVLENVKKNMTLTAKYKTYIYAIFLDEDGEELARVKYDQNSTVSPIAYTPKNRAKFNFLGWHVKDDEEHPNDVVDFELSKFAYTTYFTPVLTIKQVNITFYSEDDVVSRAVANFGDLVKLPQLKRDGYKLEGWYFDKDLQMKAEEFSATSDLSLYAKWVEDESYEETKTIIIVACSLAALAIVFVPIIIVVTKRKKR